MGKFDQLSDVSTLATVSGDGVTLARVMTETSGLFLDDEQHGRRR